MSTEIFDPVRGTSEPGRYWTMTNMSEATPDILTPFGWDIWERCTEVGWLGSMYNFGVLSKAENVPNPDPNTRGAAVFYGRQALNVDAIRKVIARLPGLSPDDFERDLMGSVRDDSPDEKGKASRLPVIMVKAPIALRTTGRKLRAAHAEVKRWWLDEVYDVNKGLREPTSKPIDSLEEAWDRFEHIFTIHCTWRFVFQGAQSAITDAAVAAGDERLATDLMSGVGEVEESRMADDMWRLAHGEIDEDAFLRDYGFHGPNEGNLYTRVWREDPERVRALARSYASREGERPRDREARAKAAREEAKQRMLQATSAAKRPTMKWLLDRSANIIRTLQIGKAGYLMTIDGCRSAARRLGADLVAAGRLDEIDDVFFLTVAELRQLDGGGLEEARDLVSHRRKTREEFKAMQLPVHFHGMPEPLAVSVEDQAAAEATEAAAGHSVEITGAASGGGAVEGRARVVMDPFEDVDLDEGDVLVCRFTDPSWAPLMTLADALVIDIGGSASHGAVVARELGIPYVIGTQTGTTLLKDGDRILVDGENNVVRVLD